MVPEPSPPDVPGLFFGVPAASSPASITLLYKIKAVARSGTEREAPAAADVLERLLQQEHSVHHLHCQAELVYCL